MADVFLSYKREDQQIAREIAADLEAEGFSVFFDVRIDVGDSWDATIERELNAAKAVVVLWSPKSRESQWVRREAREAMERRILCPAMIARCKVPLEFSDVQAADLIGRRAGDRAHVEWRRLCDGVAKCVGRKARGIEAQAAQVLKSSPIDSISKLSQALPKLPRPAQAESRPEATSADVASNATSRRALVIGGATILGATASGGGYYGWTRVRAEGVQRAWEEARAAGTRRAVNAFLREHPGAPQRTDAMNLLRRLPLRTSLVSEMRHSGSQVWLTKFSPDGELLITGASDTDAKLWRVSDGGQVGELAGHEGWIFGAAFSPDGRWIATGSGNVDGTARIWETSTQRLIHTLNGHRRPVFSVAFDPLGGKLATAGVDGTARLWSTQSGEQLAVLQTRSSTEDCTVSFSRDGERLLTSGSSTNVWNTISTASVWTSIDGHSAIYSADGTKVLALSGGAAAVLRASDGVVLQRFGEHVQAADINADGTLVATASAVWGQSEAWARLYRPSGSHTELAGVSTSVLELRFSADGSRLLTGSDDGTVAIWDAASGSQLAAIDVGSSVRCTEFSPSGRYVAAGDSAGSARIWEVDEEA